MAQCGDNKNPLIRGGTSQADRSLASLKPGYISVDEHDYQDWIVFANEFAGFLNYFDATNTAKGDWQPFFTSDISSQLGSIAIQNIDSYREEIKKRFDFLKKDDNRNDIAGQQQNLNELFSALLTLSKALDNYQSVLTESITLKNTILTLLKNKLAPALNRLISYYKEALSLNYLTSSSFGDWKILNMEIIDAGEIINTLGLSTSWIINGPPIWSSYINGIQGNLQLFVTSLSEGAALSDNEKEYLRIQHAANHNLFSGIFDQYLFAYTKIINAATGELSKTLTDYNSHQPHYALFLSFLKLFKYAQQQSNTITKRHLDFYYSEVLRLKPKDPVPNKAHVLVELAKQVDNYLLAKGTQLKAGKDSKGKEVLYSLDNDSTFSKAKVTGLSSLYFANADDSVTQSVNSSTVTIQNNAGRLFASPFANSMDGLGAALTSANKEWHPYVHKEFKEETLEQIEMPKASIGFAIASHYLYLTEGERKVFIILATSTNNSLKATDIDCYLTTAKGWYKVISPSVSTSPPTGASAVSEISFTIPGDQPAIVNYDTQIHGGTFNCVLPVIKVVLKQNEIAQYGYNILKNITVHYIKVRVEVGMSTSYNQNGLKNLLVSNDTGSLDISKPVLAFGSQPKQDATFVIGNKEVFSKTNAAVSLNVEWAHLPAASNIQYSGASDTNNDYPNTKVQFLSGGSWKDSSPVNTTPIFNGANSKVMVFALPQVIPNTAIINHSDDYPLLSSSSKAGFIRLVLNGDFGYKSYIDDLTTYLIAQSKPSVTTPTPFGGKEPYTPTIQSIYLSYSAYQTIDLTSKDSETFDEREIRLFHIVPFGEAEQHNYLNTINNTAGEVYLFPQFKHAVKIDNIATTPEYHIGEFYIGIENLKANEGVNILFQVLEGSTNPRVAKPANQITWSYLSNNFWFEFLDQQVSDSTLDLLQSGIISFSIPSKATINNTLLPTGKIWIRAAISSAADAISKLLTVDAQAAVSTFISNNNADDFLNTPLAPGIITKLKTPDAAIKKINQPYTAFGGRPKENEDHFYIRVSERLRHKAKAITIWDYEHLVLEAFPEIYKVKCLNHTSISFDSNGNEFTNEIKPGHVLIITIPVLNNGNQTNPLKPYTNQDTLTKIENYLKERISCFITLKTRQPIFEEVGLTFSLKLYDEYKDFTFYSNKLRDEITQYLTPWAYNGNADIQFGGKVYKSLLINFIEERYYVDYITDVILYHKINGIPTHDIAIEEITASTSRSILVSVPASQHNIIPV